MFRIERERFDKLGFDFDAALAQFRAAKDAHAFTVGIPAPTAHPAVEAAYHKGGYEIIEPEPPPPLPPPTPEEVAELARQTTIRAAPERAEIVERLRTLSTLDEARVFINGKFPATLTDAQWKARAQEIFARLLFVLALDVRV